MMYRASDGRTFSTFQSFCQHQAYLSRTAEERHDRLEEKEKMVKYEEMLAKVTARLELVKAKLN